MGEVLAKVTFAPLVHEVWSNVTAQPHERKNPELLRQLLVEQLVSPVRWSQSCAGLIAAIVADESRATTVFHELAPGSVLKGLMRRIDKSCEVVPHDQPTHQPAHPPTPVATQP
ncbi:MAG: ACP S-malonyltransferase [Planctomycetota bacterium]|nr:MAG: ACP S-malonyltransferase [Planctomycetota bacterium]